NLGQGQPETGPIAGAPPRVHRVAIDVDDQEYAPIPGIWELREAIAGLYNRLYRRGMPSQYSAENVSVSGGGRAALTREVAGRGLSALLLSNPCNPTGKLVHGQALAGWVSLARELDCALLLDEFYSHYVWAPIPGDLPIESAARYVEDVDRDPVVIFDGLTKNWRYPGWRVTWTIGPRPVIEAVASAGSFLDGGGSKPLQRAAIPLLEDAHVRAETEAIHRTFGAKRERLLSGL